MKNLLLLILSSVLALANAPKAEDWISEVSSVPFDFFEKEHQLEDDYFYECKITKLGTAISRLEEREFIALTEKLAVYYAGRAYQEKEGYKPYLVRGAFANYTGGHTLFLKDRILLIRHDSLGRYAHPMFCPLVVQLKEPPNGLFIHVGSAL